ncbi:heterogeneous nuclear ribonucleoprotein 1-like isoform X1 [Humulus lupulus]|uniref:heterogeneous nuclear ribonucleoprotein 1-like isoform X1 n=2 Tax=Humulus lupulus TaxID=3486 RepID=UPI002B406B25|nr:heterogeneous nuclear ribonucleoprotein 1-like isoform X1 [Humulus lupulus]XP_062088148.1 heterogeneous nuclear ribonucleoprotein 1-like isoform X1 [Humulus lupulus]XP_062088149.1 heterogeneous nuclear ribonucleoprotein 1-like isoform X1 [Humulus lupulus]
MSRMEMEPGKLFVGGISWDTNEDRLREYFQAFGDVMEAVIMKDRATGRARGFGFIVFADPAVAEKVVIEKHVIDGRIVEAKKAVPRDDQNIFNRSNSSIHGSPGPTRTKKIFVGGLASTVTESDFKRYFDQFGIITDVVVMYDHNTQRPRGFGFITYDSEDAVDKVLYKTFHELNGKMVEVKRAVPKELSPGPSRGQLGGFSQGIGRVSSLLNGYSQGYNLNSIPYGRFSPVTIGRSGFSPFSSGYAMGMNLETGLSPSYGVNANHGSNLSYGRVVSPSYGGTPNRYNGATGYGGGNEGSSSILSTSRNLWGNGNLNYAANSTNSNAFLGSGGGNTGVSSFGSIGTLWGSSPNANQGGGAGSTYSTSNLSYGGRDASFVGSGSLGFGRNGTNVAAAASYAANGSYDGTRADIYDGGSLYGDATWRSSPSEIEGSGSFGFGLGNGASDVMSKNSGYIGGYGVTNRQSARGIAA